MGNFISTTTKRRSHPEALQSHIGVSTERFCGLWYIIGYVPSSWQPDEMSNMCVRYRTPEPTHSPHHHIELLQHCFTNDGTGIVSWKATLQPARSDQCVKYLLHSTRLHSEHWLLELDLTAYQWAVVADPNGAFVWILSRKRHMEQSLLDELLQRLIDVHGYDSDLFRYPVFNSRINELLSVGDDGYAEECERASHCGAELDAPTSASRGVALRIIA